MLASTAAYAPPAFLTASTALSNANDRPARQFAGVGSRQVGHRRCESAQRHAWMHSVHPEWPQGSVVGRSRGSKQTGQDTASVTAWKRRRGSAITQWTVNVFPYLDPRRELLIVLSRCTGGADVGAEDVNLKRRLVELALHANTSGSSCYVRLLTYE